MPLSPLSSSLGLETYKGPWTKQTTTHLLNRVLFGAKHAEIQQFLAKGLNTSVTELLNPTDPIPPPPVNEYNTATVIDPAVAPGTTWINHPTNDDTINALRRNSFLFWGNHFGTEADTISFGNYVYQHHDTLRKNALGNYKTIVKAITIDPGMLRYLNGYLNSATAPDENYGRELQELYTVGKDNTVQYSESDVKAAARVLTGWGINANFTSYFDATEQAVPNTNAGYELSFIRRISKQTNKYATRIKAASDAVKQQVTYPNTSLANQLKIVSRLIKGGLKTKIYLVNYGGFDTHAAQAVATDTSTGAHANLLGAVSEAIGAFQNDIKNQEIEDRVIGMTYSEFGRRIKSNASGGTDHGAAAPLFLFGKNVRGGVFGDNPTIPTNVSLGDNVPYQYDFRTIYNSI